VERAAILADTDPVISALQLEQWRSMTPTERFELSNRLSIDVAQLAIAGIRFRCPDATSEAVIHELARRRYGDDVARPLSPRSTS